MQPSAWINYPLRYKFIGVEVLLNFDKTIIDRNTYDILRFFGDLGGLFEALRFMGEVLVRGFAGFNAGSFLVSRLYKHSSKEYQKSRSIMKHKITQEDHEEKKEEDVFKKFGTQVIRNSLVQDF